MKKILILLCLFGLFGNAIEVYNVSGNSTNRLVTKVDGWVQIDYQSLLVPTGNSFEATIGYAGGLEYMYIPKPVCSTGGYTSATIDWKVYPIGGTVDNAYTISTSVLNVNTALTTFITSLFTVKMGGVPTSNRVTASMLFRSPK